jgi:outer membrane protein assembly factor BamB
VDTRRLLLGIATVALGVPAQSHAAGTCQSPAWPQLERTAAHAGVGPAGTGIGRGNAARLRPAWRVHIGSSYPDYAAGTAASPLVACGVVYAASIDGHLSAVSAASGKLIWRDDPTSSVFYTSTPAIVGGILAVMGTRTSLDGYSTATGRLRWSVPVSTLEGGAQASVLAFGGTLAVLAQPNELETINPLNGKLRWRAFIGSVGSFLSSPAYADGLIFVGVDDSLYAVDAASGGVRWSAPTGAVVWSTPTVSDGVVYVGSNDHSVYAFDEASGAQLWAFATGAAMYSSAPIAVGSSVFVGSLDRMLHALDAATGAQQWTFPTNGAITGSPVVAGGVVFFGSQDGHVYGLDRATGKQLFAANAGAPIDAAPALGARTLYVTTTRSLIAYRLPA